MARRRMFTREFIESDRFGDLPVNVQMLYVYMCMQADDEGFVSAAKRLTKLYDCPDGLELLEKADFVIAFPSGVYAITDWHLNNTIRKDRSAATTYVQERNQMMILNGRYVPANCQPNDNQLATQNRIEQNRIENNRIEQNRSEHPVCPGEDDGDTAPGITEVYLYFQEHGLNQVSALDFWAYYNLREWTDEDGNPIRDWRALAKGWNRKRQTPEDQLPGL